MKILKELVLILFVVIFSIQISSQTDNSEAGQKDELVRILENCADYCERLDNITLHFVCEEKITEIINNAPFLRITSMGTGKLPTNLRNPKDAALSNERNTFVYDYQLKRQGSVIDEHRILLKEKSRVKNIANAQLQTKRFQHKYVVYGPIGLLGRKQQEKFKYSILDEATYKGDKAVIIEATPKFPDEFDALYGRIWIGKEDPCILKIEWNPESLKNYEEIERIAQQNRVSPKLQFVSEYGFEKNKIRFPNKYYVEEIYILPSGRRYSRSKTTVVYDNYKFFIVETTVKY